MLTEGQNLHSPLFTAIFLLSDSSGSLSEQMSFQVSAEAALTADDSELSTQSPIYQCALWLVALNVWVQKAMENLNTRKENRYFGRELGECTTAAQHVSHIGGRKAVSWWRCLDLIF